MELAAQIARSIGDRVESAKDHITSRTHAEESPSEAQEAGVTAVGRKDYTNNDGTGDGAGARPEMDS